MVGKKKSITKFSTPLKASKNEMMIIILLCVGLKGINLFIWGGGEATKNSFQLYFPKTCKH